MPRTNKDVEDLHAENARGVFDTGEDEVTELFEECFGDSASGKSVCYGDHKAKYRDRYWFPKSMINSGEIKINKLSNRFEITMPTWFAEQNGLA